MVRHRQATAPRRQPRSSHMALRRRRTERHLLHRVRHWCHVVMLSCCHFVMLFLLLDSQPWTMPLQSVICKMRAGNWCLLGCESFSQCHLPLQVRRQPAAATHRPPAAALASRLATALRRQPEGRRLRGSTRRCSRASSSRCTPRRNTRRQDLTASRRRDPMGGRRLQGGITRRRAAARQDTTHRQAGSRRRDLTASRRRMASKGARRGRAEGTPLMAGPRSRAATAGSSRRQSAGSGSLRRVGPVPRGRRYTGNIYTPSDAELCGVQKICFRQCRTVQGISAPVLDVSIENVPQHC